MKKLREFLYVFLFCVPFAIMVYIVAHIGILIFNLIKFMKTKEINEIEVYDFVEVPPRKLVHYNEHTLIDTESGLLYDKETLKVVGHDNY